MIWVRSLLLSASMRSRSNAQGKGVVAFAFRPVARQFYELLDNSAIVGSLAAHQARLAGLVGAQVFVGMVAVALVPRLSPSFVEVLRSGGVRFKYMSPESTRTTVAFAGKLGLETQWSFVISLKEADDGAPPPLAGDDATARFAELVDQLHVKPPAGVDEVRQYIEQTQDDMPLRVAVHTNCTKASIKAMIELMQEQGEIVCVVGATSNSSSTECYATADVAIALCAHRLDCLDSSLPVSYFKFSIQFFIFFFFSKFIVFFQ